MGAQLLLRGTTHVAIHVFTDVEERPPQPDLRPQGTGKREANGDQRTRKHQNRNRGSRKLKTVGKQNGIRQ